MSTKNKKKKGVFLGLITVDIINYLKGYPSSNEKKKAEKQLILAGGPATNAALTFSKLGNKSCLITVLGDHYLAEIAKRDLLLDNVFLVDLALEKDKPPIISNVIVDVARGDRAVVYTNPGGQVFKTPERSELFLEQPDIIMLDGHYANQFIPLLMFANEANIPVVMDCGSWKEGTEKILGMVDYAICSEDFFPSDCLTTESTQEFLHSMGIRNIAITRGADEICVFNSDGKKKIKVPQVNVIDTLGAGDVFHGAFCHYILRQNFVKSLEKAAVVASQSCTRFGPRL